MTMTMLRRYTPALFALAGAMFVGSTAYGQFWDYRTDVDILVSGTSNASASILAPGAGIDQTDTGSTDLANAIAVLNSAVLDFADSASVDASLGLLFQDGCRTRAQASVDATTAYAGDGDDDSIELSLSTRRDHDLVVTRGATGGPGSGVSLSTLQDIPQAESVTILLPIRVAGHPAGGLVTIDDFSISRTDSAFAYGNTTCSWEWFDDRNSNGVIDPTELTLGAQVGIISENGSFTAPSVSFQAPRGYHILRITYFSSSSFSEYSADCSDPVDEDADSGDTVTLDLSLS